VSEVLRRTVKVTVEYLGYIKQALNAEQSELITLRDNATVGDLLALLAEKHGDTFKKAIFDPKEAEMKPHHILAVNGLLINQLGDLEAKLKDGDHLVVMPIVTGG
jgi:MoaD family protein